MRIQQLKSVYQTKFKNLACRDYHLAKALYMHSLARRYKDLSGGIIVYQMGKVGSSSVLKSLKSLEPSTPIFHVHDLMKTTLARDEIDYKKSFKRRPFRQHQFWDSLYLSKKILKSNNRGKWKIITLIRDPIARNISSFFQTFDIQLKFDENKINELKKGRRIDELIRIFLDEVEWHDYPLEWFDTELKSVFNIDVYASAFPKEKGYAIYRGQRADVLLIRLEDLTRCCKNAFEQYLGIKDFHLVKSNIGKEKDYHYVYGKFKDAIILPADYIDRMYDSKFMKHFYSQEEINNFRLGWRKKGCC